MFQQNSIKHICVSLIKTFVMQNEVCDNKKTTFYAIFGAFGTCCEDRGNDMGPEPNVSVRYHCIPRNEKKKFFNIKN